MVRVRIRVKVRVSVIIRVSIRTSWVVNFALFRCYRPVIYTRPAAFLDPVWCTKSIVLTVKGCSALTRLYFNCVSYFSVKSMQHLSEKTQFLGFLFPQVVQKQ